MNRVASYLFALVGALAVSLAGAPSAHAQNPFETVIRVNARAITAFDLQQRTLFLRLLNAGGDPEALAREQLINERLQLDAGQLAGITVPEDAVINAQTEFAARGNLERIQFIEALAEQGVEEGTFRNFLEAGLVWREVVRQRFGPRVSVTEEEVRRALATIPSTGGVRVLVTELILPSGTPETERASLARAAELRQIRDFTEFSNAARRFSISASRNQGGEVGWRPLDILPEQSAAELRTMSPGQVTTPVPFVNSIVMFQLRDRENVAEGSASIVSADYAEYLIPGGQSPAAQAEAARIKAQVRTCDDLYGVALGQPAGRLTRQTLRLETLPADVSRVIAGLDENEVSTALTRGGNMVFLMLCQRTVRESGAVDLELVRRGLINQRLETFAAGYLNELRLAADIETTR